VRVDRVVRRVAAVRVDVAVAAAAGQARVAAVETVLRRRRFEDV
jgi:hypothetical protein